MNRYNNHSKRIINQSPRDSITRLYPVAVTRVGDKNGDGLIDTTNDPADSETLTYDDQGREKRGIDSDWGNTLGEALIVSNARVDANVAVYDAADRQIQVIDAAGNATLGRITSYKGKGGLEFRPTRGISKVIFA